MQIQFITTNEDLQDAIAIAVNKVFSQLSINTITPNEQIDVIDTKELCSRLAITEPTVIRWRKKGKLPFLQIGSSIRFNYSVVLKALEVGNKKGVKAV